MAIFRWLGLHYLALGILALVLLWPHIGYRKRRPARPAEPGTADHRGSKIGAPR